MTKTYFTEAEAVDLAHLTLGWPRVSFDGTGTTAIANTAAAKIAEPLEAEIAKLRTNADTSQALIDLLKAKLEAAQKDAERYRWLRENSHLEIRYRQFKRKKWFAVCNPIGNYDYDYEPTLDAAIDAALKGQTA